jgi:hypothetical protein
MRIDLPAAAVEAGCSNRTTGTHTSKTMMLPELRALLAAVRADAGPTDYVAAAVEENAMGKATAATRAKTFGMLRQLYALDPSVPIFRALRALWDADEASQATLALLCAVARDPLLRATSDFVLALRSGEPFGPEVLAREVAEAYPARYSSGVLHHIGQNTGATWIQAGLGHGVVKKTRTHASLTTPGVVYALYLGHVEGRSGPQLLASLWARLLDTPAPVLKAKLDEIARAGWIDLASTGGMTEIGFSHLDSLTRPVAG